MVKINERDQISKIIAKHVCFKTLLVSQPSHTELKRAATRRLINFVLFAIYSHQEFPFKLSITVVKQTKHVNSA